MTMFTHTFPGGSNSLLVTALYTPSSAYAADGVRPVTSTGSPFYPPKIDAPPSKTPKIEVRRINTGRLNLSVVGVQPRINLVRRPNVTQKSPIPAR